MVSFDAGPGGWREQAREAEQAEAVNEESGNVEPYDKAGGYLYLPGDGEEGRKDINCWGQEELGRV